MEIFTISGYEEVGRNMTCIEVSGDRIILDMGIRVDRIMIHEDIDISKLSKEELVKKEIIPDDSYIHTAKAIIISHGHLDHYGAVSLLASKYHAPIISLPFTLELCKMEKVKNDLYKIDYGDIIQIGRNVSVEFVYVTHSIPQTAIVVLHTSEGKIVYACDFKFDDTPTLGEKPDYDRLKEVGREGVKLLIVETTRIEEYGRCPSEKIIYHMIENIANKLGDKGIIFTTFSSHIERINNLIQILNKKQIDRKILILGRSMERYLEAAIESGLIDIPENVSIFGKYEQIVNILKEVRRKKDKFILIVTGHQGERDAVLTRIANGKLPYKIEKGDEIYFLAGTIPNPLNVAQKYTLETKLKMQGARIFKDIHVSGHAYREDHRDLIRILNPEYIIPCHGDLKMISSYVELAEEEGYRLNKDIFILRNRQGKRIE